MEDQRVQTCDFYRTDPNLPQRFNNPDCFNGYSQKKVNPLYRTSNQIYGSKKPTVHEIQTHFKAASHQFTEAQLQSGMYRDHGFNTALDRSRVMLSSEIQKKRVDLNYYHSFINQRNEHNGNNKS